MAMAMTMAMAMAMAMAAWQGKAVCGNEHDMNLKSSLHPVQLPKPSTVSSIQDLSRAPANKSEICILVQGLVLRNRQGLPVNSISLTDRMDY